MRCSKVLGPLFFQGGYRFGLDDERLELVIRHRGRRVGETANQVEAGRIFRSINGEAQEPVGGRLQRSRDFYQCGQVRLSSASCVMGVPSLIQTCAPGRLGIRDTKLLRALLQSFCEDVHENNLFPIDTYFATNVMDVRRNDM